MSISSKLFLTLLLSCLIATSGMLLTMRWSISSGMDSFQLAKQQQQLQPLLQALGNFYDKVEGWNLSQKNERELMRLLLSNMPNKTEIKAPRPPHPGPNFRGDFPSRFPLRDLALLNKAKETLFPPRGRPTNDQSNWVEFPIYSQQDPQELVGWIRLRKQPAINEAYEQVFFEFLQTTLWLSALAVFILAGVLATLLSRHFLAPLQQLAERISLLARGDYLTTVQHGTRADELGQLGRDIDDLRASLASTDNARKRWLADTSHELRTPLAIARAQLEAMQDGIRPLNKENVNAVHEEILQLQRLIEDLSELANSDIGNLRYQKNAINFSQLCQHAIDKNIDLAESAGLTLISTIAPNCWIWGDAARLEQLLANLFSNSLKYTDKNGTVQLQLREDNQQVRLNLEDSVPGVSNEELPLLFNHLYRVENSRNRKTGGSGLGLTIAKRIAQAHEGELMAKNSSLGGLNIELTLPTIAPQS
ncbi:ATP-binding protein [Simiduia curdlanivorans]|uniref:histidine kinase n=1 Tax=Simiduia curdlanivorans TaxID=1492769 RepID=A0ABV8V3Q5_9GAMM|nr:ATP-binding protein [Simiduia curdlanivorans]MDN3640097.1 ATP-binding protein [Simiduia curdlanivorans]